MMKKTINVGDAVILIGVPDWLIHDLPEDEKNEIVAFVGKVATISNIDADGLFWLGFGSTTVDDEVQSYSGHSLCVSREFLRHVEEDA